MSKILNNMHLYFWSQNLKHHLDVMCTYFNPQGPLQVNWPNWLFFRLWNKTYPPSWAHTWLPCKHVNSSLIYLLLNLGMSSWACLQWPSLWQGFSERGKEATTVSLPTPPHSGPQCAPLWNGASSSPYLTAYSPSTLRAQEPADLLVVKLKLSHPV